MFELKLLFEDPVSILLIKNLKFGSIVFIKKTLLPIKAPSSFAKYSNQISLNDHKPIFSSQVCSLLNHSASLKKDSILLQLF